MSFPRPDVDIRHPPPEFDSLIEWFERVSYHLVLLEEYALDDLRRMVRAVGSAVALHSQVEDPLLSALPRSSSESETLVRLLRADHEWFRSSTAQLEWFFSIVENEDHGGHRQALGQYGRLYAESLRRHRADERELARRTASEPGTGPPRAGAANRN